VGGLIGVQGDTLLFGIVGVVQGWYPVPVYASYWKYNGDAGFDAENAQGGTGRSLLGRPDVFDVASFEDTGDELFWNDAREDERTLVRALNDGAVSASLAQGGFVFQLWKKNAAGYPVFRSVGDTLEDGSQWWSDAVNRDESWVHDGDLSVVSTAQELAQFAWLVNHGENFEGRTVALAADIDLSAHGWVPAGAGFFADSDNEDEFVFSGIFDGGGHVVSGLVVIPKEDEPYYNAGLFGKIDGGAVYDVTLQIAQVVSDAWEVGGLAGYVYNATIENILVENEDSASFAIANLDGSYIGGVVGGAEVSSFRNVRNHAGINASSAWSIGGIAGVAYSSDIFDSSNAGAISFANAPGVSSIVGGIAGEVYGDTANDREGHSLNFIVNAFNVGRIHGVVSDVSGSHREAELCVGGIVGTDWNVNLVNVYNAGTIEVEQIYEDGFILLDRPIVIDSPGRYIGGVAGRVSAASEMSIHGGGVRYTRVELKNVLNYGAIFADDLQSGHTGGLIGLNGHDDSPLQVQPYPSAAVLEAGYWKASHEDGFRHPYVAISSGHFDLGVSSFEDAAGVLDPVDGGYNGESVLLDALNAWVTDNVALESVPYLRWRNDAISGYPVFVATVTYSLDVTHVVYNGTQQGTTVTVNPDSADIGSIAVIYYNGVATQPTDAGDYLVTIDITGGADVSAETGIFVGTFTIEKAQQEPLEITSASTYRLGSGTYAIASSGGGGTGAVTYEVAGNGTFANTISGSALTVDQTQPAGTVLTLTATKAGDNNYYDGAASAPFEVTIIEAVTYSLGVASVTYNGDPQGTTIVVNPGGADIGIVSILYNGVATLPTDAGDYLVTINITGGADAVAAAGIAVGTFTIEKAWQGALTITSADSHPLDGTTYTIASSGGDGVGAVTYAVADNATFVNTVAGSVLTIDQAQPGGTELWLTATKADDGNYYETTSAPFKLTLTALPPATELHTLGVKVTRIDVSGDTVTLGWDAVVLRAGGTFHRYFVQAKENLTDDEWTELDAVLLRAPVLSEQGFGPLSVTIDGTSVLSANVQPFRFFRLFVVYDE
jgi:hypothetical protein